MLALNFNGKFTNWVAFATGGSPVAATKALNSSFQYINDMNLFYVDSNNPWVLQT